MNIKLKNIYLSESKQVSYTIFEYDWKFEFQEWQFVMLEKEIDWKKVKRAYSIATTNEESKNNQIWFIVKKASENWMSNYLTQIIKPWDELLMSWPHWHLVDKWENNDYLLVSVWSWVWPILSIYKLLIRQNRFNKIVNFFWERFNSNLVDVIKNSFVDKENVKNFLYMSREESLTENWNKWYVQDWILEWLKFLETKNISVFLCWIPKMVDEVKSILFNNWIDKKNIKFEKY